MLPPRSSRPGGEGPAALEWRLFLSLPPAVPPYTPCPARCCAQRNQSALSRLAPSAGAATLHLRMGGAAGRSRPPVQLQGLSGECFRVVWKV